MNLPTQLHNLSLVLPLTYPPQSNALQPTQLLAQLLPYQQRALSWMLHRECVAFVHSSLTVLDRSDADLILWKPPSPQKSVYANPLTHASSLENPEKRILGGILADEMGLGKTVMMLALILSHKPHPVASFPRRAVFEQATDLEIYKSLSPSRQLFLSTGTLIVTPPSIIYQWVSEIQRHAPDLTFCVFKGGQSTDPQSLDSFDIVITTYLDLNKELSAAQPLRERSHRRAQKYKRRISALTSILWWRVLMDEAQMVESQTKATQMARLIPRIHSWGVTGTPIGRHGLRDLRDLIQFVDKELAFTHPLTWKALVQSEPLFMRVLREIFHRNTKENLGAELILPKQSDTTYFLKLSGIERHYYDELVKKCIEEVDAIDKERQMDLAQGKDPSKSIVIPMRSWLIQLRQTCCHPQVGMQNQHLLGGRLRSMTQVLQHMIQGVMVKIYYNERQLHLNSLNLAQVKEFENDFDGAMTIYHRILKETRNSLVKIEKDLEYAISFKEKTRAKKRKLELDPENEQENLENVDLLLEDDDEEGDYIMSLRSRREYWRELEHRILFFTASCYHQMAFPRNDTDSDQERDSDRESEVSINREPLYPEYAELEEKLYREAAQVRRDLLREDETKIGIMIKKMLELGDVIADEVQGTSKEFQIYLPAEKYHGGILTAMLFERLIKLADQMNQQWDLLDKWRYTIMTAVTKDLEDADQGDDAHKPKGDEYEEGRRNQEDAMAYLDVYSKLLVDRRTLLTGERPLITDSVARPSELAKSLEKERSQFELGSKQSALRLIMAEMQSLSKKVNVPAIEVQMVSIAHKEYTQHYELQNKIIQKLEIEKRQITDLFNARITYYARLQRISDSVMALEKPDNLDAFRQTLYENEVKLQMAIVAESGRRRYMDHLLEEETSKTSETHPNRDCGICRTDVMEKGVVIPCGHVFCRECLEQWLTHHRKCPMCNQKSSRADMIAFVADAETLSRRRALSGRNQKEHYEFLDTLKGFEIQGSYGTKIDTIIRHVKYLQESEPLVKILVFSQWEQVLEIIIKGFERNKIRTIKIENSGKRKGQAAVQFREDPNITAFMMNAKSQSAGLTLVAATHVFIVEPVMSGLDQQAINRVHRIGQTRETFVWRYIMEDTVEDRIANDGRIAELAWVETNKVTDPGSGSDHLLRHYLGISKKYG